MIDIPELRKQISIFVPISDWRAMRDEAARQGIPITELCRRWMAGGLDRLRKSSSSPAATQRERESETHKPR